MSHVEEMQKLEEEIAKTVGCTPARASALILALNMYLGNRIGTALGMMGVPHKGSATSNQPDGEVEEWTFCTVHRAVAVKDGVCSLCGGDAHLRQVVLKSRLFLHAEENDRLQRRMKNARQVLMQVSVGTSIVEMRQLAAYALDQNFDFNFREVDPGVSPAPPPTTPETPAAAPEVKYAAVALIQRDGRFLCVWNERYKGWAFPGGMVEDGETNAEAVIREVAEETGLTVKTYQAVFEGEHGIAAKEGRASCVTIFNVTEYEGTPRAMEEGCPISWLTRAEFLEWSTFAPFYRKAFGVISNSIFASDPDAAPALREKVSALEEELRRRPTAESIQDRLIESEDRRGRLVEMTLAQSRLAEAIKPVLLMAEQPIMGAPHHLSVHGRKMRRLLDAWKDATVIRESVGRLDQAELWGIKKGNVARDTVPTWITEDGKHAVTYYRKADAIEAARRLTFGHSIKAEPYFYDVARLPWEESSLCDLKSVSTVMGDRLSRGPSCANCGLSEKVHGDPAYARRSCGEFLDPANDVSDEAVIPEGHDPVCITVKGPVRLCAYYDVYTGKCMTCARVIVAPKPNSTTGPIGVVLPKKAGA